MPTFVKIINNLVKDKEPYWMLKLDSISVHDYIIRVKAPKVADVYMKTKMKAFRAIDKNIGSHFDEEERVFYSILVNSKEKRNTMVDDIRILSDTIYGSMKKCLKEGYDAIFVNIAGGFHPYKKSENAYIVLEEIEKEDYEFPIDAEIDEKYYKKLIKISKWEDGKHWYAKVGEYEVCDMLGKKKWNTYDTAYNMAEWYIKNKLLMN